MYLLWEFKEQVRIQAKQEELEALNRDLHSLKRALERERIALDVKAKTLKKRYDDNEIFIAKKKKIIEDAYQQLTLDREALNVWTYFFRGVDNDMELRKRYKELLKIFHPDNKCGDTKTFLLIQTEYESLRRKYYEM